MEKRSRLEGLSEFSLIDACDSFAEKFAFYNSNRLWERELKEDPNDEKLPEIAWLLYKVGKLHDTYDAAVASGANFKAAKLPFFSIASKDSGSSEGTLAMDVFPCSGQGLIDIDEGLERMEKMAHLIGLLKKSRGQFKTIYEFLKFLSSYLQRHMFPDEEEADPLSYDAGEAIQLLEVVKFRPGQSLIHMHHERVRQKFMPDTFDMSSKLGRHSAINRDVLSLQNILRTALKEEMRKKDLLEDIQAAVQSEMAGKILDK